MPDSKNSICPLCQANGEVFYHFKDRLYHRCNNCHGIFVNASLLPTRDEEKLRYEEHNNDVHDTNYQQFVSPITSAIFKTHTAGAMGLDFGAGTGPVISKVLKDHNYSIVQYDPLFHNHPGLLDNKYDYIACCEVIEHFHHPGKEFSLLNKLLKKGALLYCMTDLYDESINFHKWYYKNDHTHVFIYHKNTIQWIQQAYGFADVKIDGRLITYAN